MGFFDSIASVARMAGIVTPPTTTPNAPIQAAPPQVSPTPYPPNYTADTLDISQYTQALWNSVMEGVGARLQLENTRVNKQKTLKSTTRLAIPSFMDIDGPNAPEHVPGVFEEAAKAALKLASNPAYALVTR